MGPMRRIKVRINGRADGGVLVMLGDDTTDEEFIAAAAKKIFKKDVAAAAAVDPAKVKMFVPGGEFEADLETMMHDEEIVLALHGSPYKHKQLRVEEREHGRAEHIAPFTLSAQAQTVGQCQALLLVYVCVPCGPLSWTRIRVNSCLVW